MHCLKKLNMAIISVFFILAGMGGKEEVALKLKKKSKFRVLTVNER